MYISQEEKKRILPLVNHVLKKYKIKGTLSIKPYMCLTVTISDAGDLDFSGHHHRHVTREQDLQNFPSHVTKECLRELLHALNNGNKIPNGGKTYFPGMGPGEYNDKRWYVEIKYPDPHHPKPAKAAAKPKAKKVSAKKVSAKKVSAKKVSAKKVSAKKVSAKKVVKKSLSQKKN